MRISSITKNAGKACNNRLYRHIRTFEKIVKNYFVIFNKKIAFCKTEFIIAKIGHLLKQLGIYNLFEDKEDVYTMFDYNWDYKFINEYISKSKGKSIEFLRKCVTDTYE